MLVWAIPVQLTSKGKTRVIGVFTADSGPLREFQRVTYTYQPSIWMCHVSSTAWQNIKAGLEGEASKATHVIHQDGDLVNDVANQDHASNLAWLGPFLVNQGETAIQPVGNGSGTLRAASVWAHDDRVLEREVLPDVPQDAGLGV